MQAQDIDSSTVKINYLTKFLIDTTDVNSKKEELTGLWIGKNSSLFKSDQKAITDSLSKEATKSSFKQPVGGKIIVDFSRVPKAYFMPEVYKRGNITSIFDKVLNVTMEYESDQKINWKLLNETKVISTYKCRKAIGRYRNRTITAWYTEEIPISEGPYTFKGLPGLVVEAYDEKDYYHFVLVSLKNVKKPIITIRNAIKTDYQKFAKKRSDFKQDPAGAFFTATGKTTPKEQQERIKKLHNSKNNYLD
ncbi:hypothetical protein OK18_19020 [Chryseobacterium gallinarum]|uniref:GLPGLI family protein n=2 Tax=Chryseobacterium gallinarum TaxID=1324352 RepID=A0A0G3M696_CHRGL|nr:hypothetical protein OK18_19020 [Chryseobacterium gallinarum]